MTKKDPVYLEYQKIIDALAKGSQAEWEEIASVLDDFPDGMDEFIGRRWITNAIDCGCFESIQWMLAQNVNMDFVDEEGYSVLHSCLYREKADRYEVMQLLIDQGADVNVGTEVEKMGTNGYSPLHLAAARNDFAAIRLLVRNGADRSLRTPIDERSTAAEEAFRMGNREAAGLIEKL